MIGQKKHDEVEERELEIAHLENLLENLKKVTHKCIDDNEQLVKLKDDYKYKYEKIQAEFDTSLELVREEYRRMLVEKDIEIKKLHQEIVDFKLYSKNEHTLKDMIVKRHEDYTEILKRELVIAKNIIKNPKLLKIWNRDMHYKNLNIYKFTTSIMREEDLKESKSVDRWVDHIDFSDRKNKLNFSNSRIRSPQPIHQVSITSPRNMIFCPPVVKEGKEFNFSDKLIKTFLQNKNSDKLLEFSKAEDIHFIKQNRRFKKKLNSGFKISIKFNPQSNSGLA